MSENETESKPTEAETIAGEAAAEANADLTAQIAALEEQVKAAQQEALYAKAEVQNVMRRAERDKADALRKFRAAERKRLGIELDPLVEARADDGLLADERNVAESVAREQAAEKVTDPLLRASAAILGDAIGLLGKDAKLAAQVLPEARTAGHWVD